MRWKWKIVDSEYADKSKCKFLTSLFLYVTCHLHFILYQQSSNMNSDLTTVYHVCGCLMRRMDCLQPVITFDAADVAVADVIATAASLLQLTLAPNWAEAALHAWLQQKTNLAAHDAATPASFSSLGLYRAYTDSMTCSSLGSNTHQGVAFVAAPPTADPSANFLFAPK